MGRSLSSPSAKLQEFAKLDSEEPHRHRVPKRGKPFKRNRVAVPPPKPTARRSGGVRLDPDWRSGLTMESSDGQMQNRVPLSVVVSDCVQRWFQDTLKEAKDGNIAMQVLVGQMYFSGYGVPADPIEGRAWMSRASKRRSSVWLVSEKRPGYNVSDSDSDEMKGEDK